MSAFRNHLVTRIESLKNTHADLKKLEAASAIEEMKLAYNSTAGGTWDIACELEEVLNVYDAAYPDEVTA